MPDSAEVTLVLADDHPIVREGLTALCAREGFRILGQCSDGAAAVEMISSLKPDVALLDMQMDNLNGTEVIRQLRAASCRSKLFILSINGKTTTVAEALDAGADAYLLKDGLFRHVLDAINFVRDGGVYISPLLGGAAFFKKSDARRDADPLERLSTRERQVFTHLVNGVRAKDIAVLLGISPKTVDTYRANLMHKLKVDEHVGLVKFAIERNLTGTSGENDQ